MKMGGKGGATRSNTTINWGKQKANWRWEVEVAHRDAGTCQEDERRSRHDSQPDKRQGRPWCKKRQQGNKRQRRRQMWGKWTRGDGASQCRGSASRDQEEAAAWQQGLRVISAISRRGISPVNPPQIMHTLWGKAREHGGSGKIFVGGREEEMGN